MLPLEGQRRTLRVVLVIGAARAGRLRESRELPLQGGHLPHRTRPLRQQQFARVSHPPDDSPFRNLVPLHATGACGHEGLAG